jgi:hypothetical protein
LVVLPQASVAVQVRVRVPVPAHPVSAPASECERVGGAPELSVAIAWPVAAGSVEWPHGTVAFSGRVRTGGVKSTSTVVEAVSLHPVLLVTVTVYVPAFAALADGIVGFCAELVKPPGPFQAYDVPPFAEREIVFPGQ